MKTITRISFSDLWAQVAAPDFFPNYRDHVQFAEDRAYHLYADLGVNLDLAAAEDATHAMRYLDIVEDFATIADRCCPLFGARILEVQGNRVHFVISANAPQVDGERLLSVVAFAVSLYETAYGTLKRKYKDDVRGFSVAGDYGPAAFVPSTFGGGSIVSLGNAANRPAKRLNRGVDSGYLALPTDFAKSVPAAFLQGDWVLINIAQPVVELTKSLNKQLRDSATYIAEDVVRNRKSLARTFVNRFDAGALQIKPFRARGMAFRADLCGFTKAVEAAFAKGPDAVQSLVQHFMEVMEYPLEFARLQPEREIIELPWEGDCCNLLVQPGFQESVEEMRAVLPVEGGRQWNGIEDDPIQSKKWKSALGEAKWAVGFACGDKDDGGNGWSIIAEIATSQRRFRVIAGWCARRAKDAQECSGIGSEDVAIPKIDYDNIEYGLKPLFAAVPSHPSYWFTTYAKLRTAKQSVVAALAGAAAVRAVGVPFALPRPKPYGGRHIPGVPTK